MHKNILTRTIHISLLSWLLLLSASVNADKVFYCQERVESECILYHLYDAIRKETDSNTRAAYLGLAYSLASWRDASIPIEMLDGLTTAQFQMIERMRYAGIAAFYGATGKHETHQSLVPLFAADKVALSYYLTRVSTSREAEERHRREALQKLKNQGNPTAYAEALIGYLSVSTHEDKAVYWAFSEIESSGMPKDQQLIHLADVVALAATLNYQDAAKELYQQLSDVWSSSFEWLDVGQIMMSAMHGQTPSFNQSSAVFAYAAYYKAMRSLGSADGEAIQQNLLLLMASISELSPSQQVYFYHRLLTEIV